MKYLGIQIIIILTFLGLVGACSEENDLAYSAAVEEIQASVDQGELLTSVEKKQDIYIFNFETEQMEIPVGLVRNVETDSLRWRTILTLTNGSSYIIPSMGTSIDALIANVILNPSGYNPLAANVTMNLPALGRMKIIVHSKPNSYTPNVEYLFSSIEKGQTVTILGLYPDYMNQVELIYTDKQGKERGRSSLEIKTGSLTGIYLPRQINVQRVDTLKMEPGMNLVNSPGESEADTSVPYMVDADGCIRWVLDWRNHPQLNHAGLQCGLHRLKNGNYVTGDANNHQLVEVDVLGNIVNTIDLKPFGFTYHHEIRETEDGKWIGAITNNQAKLVNSNQTRILDHMAEFNPTTGELTKLWDFVQMLDSSRMVRADQDIPGSDVYGQSKSNWLHNNGVDLFENGDMLCTARWMGAFRFTRSGNVKWIIAPHDRWRDPFKKYLLTPLDRNGNPIVDVDVLNGKKVHPDFDWVWGVHCPVVLSNGHVMFFDNGYCRNYESQHDTFYSRAVEYEIDEKAMTIRQVWEFGKELGIPYYANAISGVQELKQTGHRLFCPGVGNSHIVEVNPKTQEIVFDLEVKSNSNMAFHRANRISLYPDNM